MHGIKSVKVKNILCLLLFLFVCVYMALPTHSIPKVKNSTIITPTPKPVTVDEPELEGVLYPFSHKLPNFVSEEDKRIFLMQPENKRSMESHWVPSWSWKTCVETKPMDHAYFKLFGGEIWSFQHFFDNGLPLIWQVRKSFSDLRNIYTYIEKPRNHIVLELWKKIGFTNIHFTDKIGHKNHITPCIFPRNSQVRSHPVHVEMLRSLFTLPTVTKRKIIWIDRKHAAHGRKVTNQNFVLDELRNRYDVHSFTHCETIKMCLSVFGDAEAIVGVHGGGLYNQFFASKDTKIIEIMPVKHDGLLHSQGDAQSVPRLAHRAIWHNANNIGQEFYRLHLKTPSAGRFDIDMDTLNRIDSILK